MLCDNYLRYVVNDNNIECIGYIESGLHILLNCNYSIYTGDANTCTLINKAPTACSSKYIKLNSLMLSCDHPLLKMVAMYIVYC